MRLGNYLSKSEDPMIRNTFAACVSVILIVITVLTIRFIWATVNPVIGAADDAGQIASVTGDVFVDTAGKAATATKEITGGSERFVTGERTPPRPAIANATDPIKIKEDNLPSEKQETQKQIDDRGGATVVVSEQQTPSIMNADNTHFTLQSQFQAKSALIRRDAEVKAGEISALRAKEVDAIFEGAVKNIPAFVDQFYEQRHQAELFRSLMNENLLKDEALELFLINTANEVDHAIFQVVNKHLDGLLQEIDLKTSTKEELKKRLPTAREICDSVYAGLEKIGANSVRTSELGSMFERLSTRHHNKLQIGKVAFVAIIGYLWPPSIPYTVSALIVWFIHDVKVQERKEAYKEGLADQFKRAQRQYRELVSKSIKDLVDVYISALLKAPIIEIPLERKY